MYCPAEGGVVQVLSQAVKIWPCTLPGHIGNIAKQRVLFAGVKKWAFWGQNRVQIKTRLGATTVAFKTGWMEEVGQVSSMGILHV